jgi:glycosyltransferase involved in cell wall biosynthesis
MGPVFSSSDPVPGMTQDERHCPEGLKSMEQSDTLKVLHVVGSVREGGGVQTWLLQLRQHLDPERFAMDVLTYHGMDTTAADQLREMGCNVYSLTSLKNPLGFLGDIRGLLRGDDGYDVVHSSIGVAGGLVVKEAHAADVPVRIVHSRGSRIGRRRGFLWDWCVSLMRSWMFAHATDLLGVSRDAAAALYTEDMMSDPRVQVVASGIDLTPFSQTYDRGEVRAKLGIPDDVIVIGNVSRLAPGKNQRRVLEVTAHLHQQGEPVRALLVGDGPMERELRTLAAELGIDDVVVMAGYRDDVPRLMKGAMDVFVFPSEHEGQPRVVIEAQAAGLGCVISKVMPLEVDASEQLIHRIPLSRPVDTWATATMDALHAGQQIDPTESYEQVAKSPLNIANSAKQVEQIYERAAAGDTKTPASLSP